MDAGCGQAVLRRRSLLAGVTSQRLAEDKWSLNNYAQYQVAKKKISDLGYVETSPEMYDAWMKDIQNEIERRKQTATNH